METRKPVCLGYASKLVNDVVCKLLLNFCFQTFGPIGGLFGGLVAWPISEVLGRQTALILSGVPALAGWLMITYSTLATTTSVFLGLLYVGRVLTGFSTGWAVFCVSVRAIMPL